eukprot:Blabericola_migrator_1__7242@NODE_367_length_9377_cov_157_637487_g294_i0_p4_GENE_NODE_367_length_9377_cov_157_637487_g294_i0NODE_367_length_9377_cov_157_637487_g294_i0_p4_ORF_typecomplete_len371_score56_88_NODE_367_length_9377_cov_157_637487_g294_i018502962
MVRPYISVIGAWLLGVACADVTVGRLSFNVSGATPPFPITTGKRLRAEIEKILEKTRLPLLIFQGLSVPHIDGLTVDSIPSSLGTLLSLKDEESRSMSGMVSSVLFDSLDDFIEGELSDFDEGQVISPRVPAVSVVTDVPNLITASARLIKETYSPSATQARMSEIQKQLLREIATLDETEEADTKTQLSDPEGVFGTSVCKGLLEAELRALTAVAEAVAQSKAETSTQVLAIALTQGISCYADEGNKAAILAAITLLAAPLDNAGVRVTVPTETWAPVDVVIALAKSLSQSTQVVAARRRLQGTEGGAVPPIVQRDISNDLSYVKAERRIIFTGVAISLTVAALAATVATANMHLNKDPLLYTKINTAH